MGKDDGFALIVALAAIAMGGGVQDGGIPSEMPSIIPSTPTEAPDLWFDVATGKYRTFEPWFPDVDKGESPGPGYWFDYASGTWRTNTAPEMTPVIEGQGTVSYPVGAFAEVRPTLQEIIHPVDAPELTETQIETYITSRVLGRDPRDPYLVYY